MDKHEFCNYISSLALKSMIYEVSATPKPGLVDRTNSGAHKDMDFFTFIDSSLVLASYFYECTRAGIDFKDEDYRNLLRDIRPLGIEAEKKMFQATCGINTHKGLIFSLGIIGSAAGNIFSRDKTSLIRGQEICRLTKAIGEGLTKELEDAYLKTELTYGENLYVKYGLKGIRGEVESGFSTVMNYSLPLFKDLMCHGKIRINEVMINTLLSLIANTEDSNILGRHDMDTLLYAQGRARDALELGGYLSEEGKDFVKDMDNDFIERNISPGGSADLLAVTLMVYLLEKGGLAFNEGY